MILLQAYYYNFGDNRALQEAQQKRNEEAIWETEQKEVREAKGRGEDQAEEIIASATRGSRKMEVTGLEG